MTSGVGIEIRKIIALQAMLDVKSVQADSVLNDLGIDSMGVVEAIFAIEDAFDISVPFNANGPEKSNVDFATVATIVAAVEDLIKQKAKCTA